MARRLLDRWEALQARHQVMVSAPVLAVLLFVVHEAFFPRLQWHDSLLYALMECVPLALVVTFATQSELARRERGDAEPPGGSVD